MLEILPESQGNILGFRARKQVSLEDFRRELAPRLAGVVAELGKARILLVLGDDFEGFDREALKGEVMGSLRQDEVEKIAVVGGSWWTRLEVRLGAGLLTAEVETFAADKLEEAWEWIRE